MELQHPINIKYMLIPATIARAKLSHLQTHPIVYKGHAFIISLRLCNRHINQYPREVLSAVNLAATDHFMPALYTRTNPQPTTWGMIAGYANGSHMQATAIDTLDLPQLPANARGCHKFKDISLPLISVLKLSRARCNVNFHQNTVTITDNRGTELITGERDPTRNLYMIKVPIRTLTDPITPTSQTVAGTYTLRTTKNLVQYLHATTGFLPLVTFTSAIN